MCTEMVDDFNLPDVGYMIYRITIPPFIITLSIRRLTSGGYPHYPFACGMHE